MIINYSDQEVIKNSKSIFLAGPTPRGEEIKSWRGEACSQLEKMGFDGVVYVPEYSTGKAKADYTDQAMWEREALSAASCIAFWVPRELNNMPAFTTNVEFGYWLHTGKVVYGRPNDASKIKYLDWLYGIDYNKRPFDKLEDLLVQAICLADKLYDGNSLEILPIQYRKILGKVENK